MKKPICAKVLRAIAIMLMIAVAMTLVLEWRIRHNPIVVLGWPMDIYIAGSGGNGLHFTQRNTYGRTLYYSNGFRIYRYEADEWKLVHTQPREHIRRIRPNIIRSEFVEWRSATLPDGQYRFARDFFLNARTTTVYRTLYADFEVLCWEARSDIRENYHLQGGASPWRRDYIAFLTAGASSRAIVPAGKVQVSRTAITFMSRNRSLRVFDHGDVWELAHYVNGTWQPVPHTPGEYNVFRLSLGGGFGVLPRTWWPDTKRLDFMHGELPPGRYMFIRRHFRSHDDNWGRYFNYEYMMFEFTINENTPISLPESARVRANTSAIISGVIVRAGFVIAIVMLLKYLKRYRGQGRS